MNNVTLIGRLVADPELRFLQTGTAICNFTIAIDRSLSKDKKQEMKSKGQPTADFIKINVWGKMGESSANHLAKGLMVAVQGRITSGSYTKDDGTKVYTTEVTADKVKFLDWKDKQQGNGGNDRANDDFSLVDSEDIPF